MREYLFKYLGDMMLISVQKCGQYLYDDYMELHHGAAKRLEESLNQKPSGGEALPPRHSPTYFTDVVGLIPLQYNTCH